MEEIIQRCKGNSIFFNLKDDKCRDFESHWDMCQRVLSGAWWDQNTFLYIFLGRGRVKYRLGIIVTKLLGISPKGWESQYFSRKDSYMV